MESFDPKYDFDCTGLEPWEVLQALFLNTQQIGLGRFAQQQPMTETLAREFIQEWRKTGLEEYRFDYVMGRPIKVWFVEPADGQRWWITRVDLYNRDSLRPAAVILRELARDNGIQLRG